MADGAPRRRALQKRPRGAELLDARRVRELERGDGRVGELRHHHRQHEQPRRRDPRPASRPGPEGDHERRDREPDVRQHAERRLHVHDRRHHQDEGEPHDPVLHAAVAAPREEPRRCRRHRGHEDDREHRGDDRPVAEPRDGEREAAEEEPGRERDRDRPHEERDDGEAEPDPHAARVGGTEPRHQPREAERRERHERHVAHEARTPARSRWDTAGARARRRAPLATTRRAPGGRRTSRACPRARERASRSGATVYEKPPIHANSVPHQMSTGGKVELHGDTEKPCPFRICSTLIA